jgi:hypothetical protein
MHDGGSIMVVIGDTVLHSWEVLASILSSDKTLDILCDIGMYVHFFPFPFPPSHSHSLLIPPLEHHHTLSLSHTYTYTLRAAGQ